VVVLPEQFNVKGFLLPSKIYETMQSGKQIRWLSPPVGVNTRFCASGYAVAMSKPQGAFFRFAGCGQDCDETKSRISLRSGVARVGDA